MKLLTMERIKLWKEISPIFQGMADGKLDSVKMKPEYRRYDSFKSIHKFLSGFSNLIRMIAKVTKGINDDTMNISKYSNQIKEESQSIKEAFLEINEGIQTSTSEVENASNQIDLIADSLNQMINGDLEIKEASKEIERKVNDGLTAVIDTSQHFLNLGTQNNNLSNSISEILIKFQSVQDSIFQIQSISNRTKLVALNASIEASHAGESGKGFAIVADEVSKLSNESAEFTQTVLGLMKKLKEEIQSTKVIIDTSRSLSDKGTKKMDSALQSYQEIVESNELMVKKRKEFMNGISIVENGFQILRKVISNTVQMTEEISASANHVALIIESQFSNVSKIKFEIEESFRKSRVLASLVSQFKLKQERNLSNEQKIVEEIIENAIEIRGIMVTMIQSNELDFIKAMVSQKIKKENEFNSYLLHCDKILELSSSQKEKYLEFKKTWASFGEIRDTNTKLMLEGKYQEARDNLIQVGRHRFKKSLDILIDWLQELEE